MGCKGCDEEKYMEHLDEIYGDVNICGYAYSSGKALKDVDPTAFRCGMADEGCTCDCTCGEDEDNCTCGE